VIANTGTPRFTADSQPVQFVGLGLVFIKTVISNISWMIASTETLFALAKIFTVDE
jgi:hypothetical protein